MGAVGAVGAAAMRSGGAGATDKRRRLITIYLGYYQEKE